MDEILLPRKQIGHGSGKAAVKLHRSDTETKEYVESRNARMRQHWDKAACKELGISDRYQNVHVLMIGWAEKLDRDLKCAVEYSDLKTLLETKFKYTCHLVKLNIDKKPHNQLNFATSAFLHEHDGPCRSTLLIVYYSGHGYCRVENGVDELYISAKVEPGSLQGDDVSHLAEARWGTAEAVFRGADADVLTIMDCCFASSVVKSTAHEDRTFETLAATTQDLLASPPGPRSYTRALINSLEEKLKQYDDHGQKPFDTFQLNKSIKRRLNSSNLPQLHDRNYNATTRHIRLAPLERSVEVHQRPVAPSSALSLQVVFETKTDLTNTEIATLAANLANAAKESHLGIAALDWTDFSSSRQYTAEDLDLLRLARFKWLVHGAVTRFRLRQSAKQHPNQDSAARLKRSREEGVEQLNSTKYQKLSAQTCDGIPGWLTPETPQSAFEATTPDPRWGRI